MEPDRTEDMLDELVELAEVAGVDTSFWGGDQHRVPVDALRAVLSALGVAADTADEVRRSRAELELAPWRRLLPPVVVVR